MSSRSMPAWKGGERAVGGVSRKKKKEVPGGLNQFSIWTSRPTQPCGEKRVAQLALVL